MKPLDRYCHLYRKIFDMQGVDDWKSCVMGHTVTLSPVVDSMLREMDSIYDNKLSDSEKRQALVHAHQLYQSRLG